MELRLPPRSDGKPAQTISITPAMSFVIIGANGAGKTRFTDAIIQSLGDKAFSLSALDALYNRKTPDADAPSSLLRRLSPAILAQAEKSSPAPTLIDMLLLQLMHDELVNLIAYKLAVAEGRKSELKPTRLDRVISLWQEVFPGNRVLTESGKILFTRDIDMNAYSAVRLSDGEKAVLYYAGAVLYAPAGAIIFVDSPEMFLHPTLTASLWNRLEALRSDCTFCYTTHDTEFTASRNTAPAIWVRDCDSQKDTWDYELLQPESKISPELYMTIVGARKPVLFIEGDSEHSIDAKLYPLIFPDYTVRSLGSCNKVIESTRTFNDLTSFHKMDSFGIVDRDRRDDTEVGYLRRKKIMVPDVAEIENMLLIEDIVRTMAAVAGKDPDRVFFKVKRAIISLFRADLRQQALLHTRHRVKRTIEYRVDARCDNVEMLEEHLTELLKEINPTSVYEEFCRQFHTFEQNENYEAILRVFNQKSILISCNVAQLCDLQNRDKYIDAVINVLRHNTPYAERIRAAVRKCLAADTIQTESEKKPKAEKRPEKQAEKPAAEQPYRQFHSQRNFTGNKKKKRYRSHRNDRDR